MLCAFWIVVSRCATITTVRPAHIARIGTPRGPIKLARGKGGVGSLRQKQSVPLLPNAEDSRLLLCFEADLTVVGKYRMPEEVTTSSRATKGC
jgi:hypothetical protein